MHVEFPSHFEAELKRIVNHLSLDAHIFVSFNSTGETVVLSAERDELERLAAADDSQFEQTGDGGNDMQRSNLKKIRAIVRGHLG